MQRGKSSRDHSRQGRKMPADRRETQQESRRDTETQMRELGDELPEGWATAAVKHLMALQNGSAFKPSQWSETGLPIVRIQNLNNPDAPFNHYDGELPSKFLIDHADLLFAWSGTPGTSFGAHVWRGGRAWLNQHIFRVIFDESALDKEFLRLAINQNLDDYIHQAHGGAGLAHITKGMFEDSELRIPPLAEQRRIVEHVEALLARVQAARGRLAKVPVLLKRFRQSVLAAACSGQLTADWREDHASTETASIIDQVRVLRTDKQLVAFPPALASTKNLSAIPEGWEWTSFGFVIGELQNGVSIKPNVDPPGNPILRISSVRPGRVLFDDVRYLPNSDALLDGCEIRDGDLLFTRYNGSLDLLGICGMVRGVGKRRMLHPDKLMRVRFDHDWIEPGYAEIFFQSPDARDRLTGMAKSSAGQQGVSGRDIKEQPFAVPPLAEQHEILRRVDALFALADKIEARVAAATARVEKITQAILAKAFRGELVPTEAELARQEGRDYEPASVLLERIRTELTDAEEKPAPRRTRTKSSKNP